MAKIHEIENWINGVKEEIIDPDMEIIDPHHHLWHGPEDPPGIKESYRYLLEDLWSDTSSGHNIKKTVFIDCGQEYYKEGPDRFKPVGETEFVVEIAKQEDFFEHIGKYILQICDLSCQFRVKLVHEYLNVAMAVKVCEGISLTLDPSLELAKVAIPTVLKAQGQILMRKGFGLDSLSRKKGEIKYLSRNSTGASNSQPASAAETNINVGLFSFIFLFSPSSLLSSIDFMDSRTLIALKAVCLVTRS